MSAITFEPVNDEYYWGYYSDFKVLIMARNGYINATQMCQDGGKRYRNWLRNQSSKELITEVAMSALLRANLIIIKNVKGVNEYRGTYVHPDLIPHIAMWISPSHAVKVSKILLEYYLIGEKEKNAIVVHQKESEIDELKSMIARMEAKSDAALKDLSNEVSKLSLDNRITHERLDTIVEDRVVRHDPLLIRLLFMNRLIKDRTDFISFAYRDVDLKQL
jgi:KilA-N domain